HDDVLPGHAFAEYDHRKFRPQGWVEQGRERLALLRPYAERHALTMLQLACAWDLAQTPVRCVAPTLIQERGDGARTIESKRAELAAVRSPSPLSADEVREIRAIGDNSGCMALKGASTEYEGAPLADRWSVDERLGELAARWRIEPARDLVKQ
ncbi:MAG TPA: aldo/keto reductase, partial [Solirubrobacteraceae bacterium]|nr:aldo/keto reductase [Solirubrobacteraceae bacterium]